MKVLSFEGGQETRPEIHKESATGGVSVTPVGDLAVCLRYLESDRDATVIVDLDLNSSGIESVQEIRPRR